MEHLCAAASDHIPILVRMHAVNDEPMIQRTFKYECMWETHPSLHATVGGAWTAPDPEAPESVASLAARLKSLSGSLQAWDRETFGKVRRGIKKLERELDLLRSVPGRTAPTQRELEIKSELLELYKREELMWKQRARLEWLRAGDKNTKYFHMRANMRRAKNKIKALLRADGSKTEDVHEMRDMTNTFYTNLYTSEGTVYACCGGRYPS